MKKLIQVEFPIFGEQDVYVTYHVTKYYPATETSPEEPSDIEIDLIMCMGVDVTEQVTTSGREVIREAICDDY